MILSKKIQIELNKKQFLIISTLLGVIDFELNSTSSELNYPTQSVFYKGRRRAAGEFMGLYHHIYRRYNHLGVYGGKDNVPDNRYVAADIHHLPHSVDRRHRKTVVPA